MERTRQGLNKRNLLVATITEEDVRHVAKLARLNLTDQQVEQFTRQLGSILAYVNKLNELDTDEIEPTAHAAALKNVFRADEPQPGIGIDQVLKNCPDHDGSFFRVPKVLDQSGAAP